MRILNRNWSAFVYMFLVIVLFCSSVSYNFVVYSNLNARVFLASLQGWRVSGSLSTLLGEVKLLILSVMKRVGVCQRERTFAVIFAFLSFCAAELFRSGLVNVGV